MPVRLKKMPPELSGEPKPQSKPKKPRKASVEPKERDIQRAIVAYLEAIGACVVRVNSGTMVIPASGEQSRRAFHGNLTPGCSDLLVCLAGKFIGVEVKRPGNKPTPKQLVFLQRVQRAGGMAITATSVEDLQAKLRAEGLLS